jgi:primosomal protein N' (replication factor Y)
MVTKGLDFEDVTLVGVLNADQALKHPDFRAYERAFQMLSQVSGRAGRKNKSGEVLLQTTDPANPMFSHVLAHDFVSFYEEEIKHREDFDYPPFSRLVRVELRHKEGFAADGASLHLANAMRAVFGNWVLGPAAPPVGRVRGNYIRHVLLKIPRKGVNLTKVKARMQECLLGLEKDKLFTGVRVDVDVDPY